MCKKLSHGNNDIIIKFAKGRIFFWVCLMLITGIFFISALITSYSKNGFQWELLFACGATSLPFYSALKYTQIFFKLSPGLVINQDGYINYLYEEPKLISWEELFQGKSICHGKGKNDWSNIYALTDKSNILVDDHFNYLILKTRPNNFIKLLEEKYSKSENSRIRSKATTT